MNNETEKANFLIREGHACDRYDPENFGEALSNLTQEKLKDVANAFRAANADDRAESADIAFSILNAAIDEYWYDQAVRLVKAM